MNNLTELISFIESNEPKYSYREDILSGINSFLADGCKEFDYFDDEENDGETDIDVALPLSIGKFILEKVGYFENNMNGECDNAKQIMEDINGMIASIGLRGCRKAELIKRIDDIDIVYFDTSVIFVLMVARKVLE